MIKHHKRYYNRTNTYDRCNISFDKASEHHLGEYKIHENGYLGELKLI